MPLRPAMLVFRSPPNSNVCGRSCGSWAGIGIFNERGAVEGGLLPTQLDIVRDHGGEHDANVHSAHGVHEPSSHLLADSPGRGECGRVTTDWLRDGIGVYTRGIRADAGLAEPRVIKRWAEAELGVEVDGGLSRPPVFGGQPGGLGSVAWQTDGAHAEVRAQGCSPGGPPFTVTFVERPDTTTSLAVRFPVVLWTEEDAIILPPDDAYGAPFYVDPPGQPGIHRDLFKTWARRVAGELATRGYPMSAAVRSHLPTEYLSDSEYIASPSERSVSE